MIIGFSGCGSGSSALDLWRGTRDYRARDYEKSLERFNAARQKNPKDARPAFNLGDSKYKLNQLDEAQKDFSSLAESEKNPVRLRRDSFFNLGNTHFQKREYKEAVEAYRRCLLLDPADEDCRFNLVKALQALKNPPQKQQQQKPNDKPKDNKSNEDKKPQGQRPDKTRPQSEMSQEDAERILQAVREKEKGTARPKPSWQKQNTPQKDDSGVDW